MFQDRETAEAWIGRIGASGMLLRYPVDVGVHEWAVASGLFAPRGAHETAPEFIENFSSTRQEHYHYDGGALAAA
ncbi:MAG: hypothetical protein AVDCRST_MAG77-195 [uncultured Chloroflexi bacterium]|uniref:DUF7710 domain-containing protein n=1 Tax=uncultured Chloroflexota bacterium TaxID=166587 RepID=A0A6J4H7P8_9CHLR|nr:MAG: hypothetical protein AVDCRST_MAG77-195 [uncultured Chloroflexota bacterium]